MRRAGCGSYVQFQTVIATSILLVVSARSGIAGHGSRSDASIERRVFTTAREVQGLTGPEAARARPVLLRGVVTYIDELVGDMFVQDKTAGIYVFLGESRADGLLRAGALVTLTGVTTPGDCSPCIAKASIHVIGKGHLPTSVRPTLEALTSGKEDGHWAEVEGIVVSQQTDQQRLLLNVSVQGGTIVAVVKEDHPDGIPSLVDSEVLLRGAVAQMHNRRRQAVGFRLMVPPGFIQIKKPAPADPFSLPASSIDSVSQYEGNQSFHHRVRIRAVVTGQDPSGDYLISGENGNLQVQHDSECVARTGDTVDIVGFPGTIDTRPALVNSTCRKTSNLSKVEPFAILPEQVLTARMQTNPSSNDFAAGMREDMSLVRMNGILVLHSPGVEGEILLLQSPSKQFMAILPYVSGHPIPELENGSSLQVVGVCLVNYDKYHRAVSFHLLLRSEKDIVVLQDAPWWNLKNAIRALMFMAFLLLAAILWMIRQSVHLRQANLLLQELSFVDGLTGVANRRKFDETLSTEWRRVSLTLRPLSLLMFDIDSFKALNDHYGHQHGDECLVQIARSLKSVPLRASDLVARYGGEEFAVILPEVNAERAISIAESIRLTILDLAIANERSSCNRIVSVSVGVATVWPDRKTSAAYLVTLADRALYRSKTDGKNRTTYLDAQAEIVPDPLLRQKDEAVEKTQAVPVDR